jgi:hypothetical protein
MILPRSPRTGGKHDRERSEESVKALAAMGFVFDDD